MSAAMQAHTLWMLPRFCITCQSTCGAEPPAQVAGQDLHTCIHGARLVASHGEHLAKTMLT